MTASASLRVHRRVVGPLATNCYLVAAGPYALIVDPGDDAPGLITWMQDLGVQVVGILNTHAHFDHVLALRPLKESLGLPHALHHEEVPVLQRQRAYLLEHFGLDPGEMPTPEVLLQDGDAVYWSHGVFTVVRNGEVIWGEAPPAHSPGLQVVHTPGHSPGSVCFRGPDFALVGDLLFEGSVGRADLRGSDPAALRRSLRRILEDWPPETRIYPGHGPETTLARECRHNPFLLEWFPDLCG